MTPHGVRKIARIAHPVFSRLKYLAMFIAYFDESGHSINADALTVAGVVAKARKWEIFEEKWRRCLRRLKVEELHMTDFENRQQAFRGLDEAKRLWVIAELAAILKKTIVCGVSASVLMETWREVMPRHFVEEKFVAKRGAYSLLFQICLEKIDTLVPVRQPEKIACVFDENNFIGGALKDHYRDWKQEQHFEDKFGSLTFDNGRNIVPLQAADMVAYESHKHLLNLVREKPRTERKLHANLWQSGRIHALGLTQDGLRSYISQVARLEELDAKLKGNG